MARALGDHHRGGLARPVAAGDRRRPLWPETAVTSSSPIGEYHAHVTQPLLLEQLQEWGLEISAGQLSALITAGHEDFHREKEALLQAGLQRSRYVQVVDTGARHAGQNGYCTHIGNELFAYFASTELKKSRINFLGLLRAEQDDYTGDRASAILARAVRTIADDWQVHYGYRPVLLEIFVEQTRFRGTTEDRGKLDVNHQRRLAKKSVWLYSLDRHFRHVLCQ